MRKVGFQGMRGAYSEMAILQAFGSDGARPCPYPSFEAVYSALAAGSVQDALLPFENSVAGMIHENFDLLDLFPVEIVAEEILEVQHCLLVLPSTKISSIRTVLSHPQALAQCARFLKDKAWEARPFFDTAGAAQHLAEMQPAHTAVIASAQAAKLYGLTIASRTIADKSENLTRFLHLRRQGKRASAPISRKGRRTLSTLLLRSDLGFSRIISLSSLLQGMGLTPVHCEARPSRAGAWSYSYFLELEGGPEHPQWQAAIEAAKALSQSVKVLGTYQSKR